MPCPDPFVMPCPDPFVMPCPDRASGNCGAPSIVAPLGLWPCGAAGTVWGLRALAPNEPRLLHQAHAQPALRDLRHRLGGCYPWWLTICLPTLSLKSVASKYATDNCLSADKQRVNHHGPSLALSPILCCPTDLPDCHARLDRASENACAVPPITKGMRAPLLPFRVNFFQ